MSAVSRRALVLELHLADETEHVADLVQRNGSEVESPAEIVVGVVIEPDIPVELDRAVRTVLQNQSVQWIRATG